MDERTRRELAAFADGSLEPTRRAAVEERVGGSPELLAAVERQRRVADALRAVDAPAPAGLRERAEAARAARPPRRSRRRFAVAGALTAFAAAVGLAFLVVSPGKGGPTVLEAAALGERASRLAAPVADSGEPRLLRVRAEGLAFPNWAPEFAWRAVGGRRDELDGRRATTVFYENRGGARVAYTILSGEAIAASAGARPAVREGVQLKSIRAGGRVIVTWLRAGRTCVLSGAGVPTAVLLKLAGWRGRGAVEV